MLAKLVLHLLMEESRSVDLAGRFATGQQEVYTFKSAKLSFFDMTDPANNTDRRLLATSRRLDDISNWCTSI